MTEAELCLLPLLLPSLLSRGIGPKDTESESLVAQLCLTFWDPTGCSRPSSSVRGVPQARILESES